MEILLSGKELAAALRRDRTYVCAMKRAGFKPYLPPNFFRLQDAIDWLAKRPDFRTTTAYACKARRNMSQHLATSNTKTTDHK